MITYQELSLLTEAALASLDLVEVNLACAWGLPGTEVSDSQVYVRTRDRWAEWVDNKTNRSPHFRQHPEQYENSWSVFRVHALIAVLQRDFGVYYNPACMAEDARLSSVDVFLHGVLLGKGGTCASLPVLITAVGRRLGYPLRLVRAHRHLFARWDDPGGERFNIEVNNAGWNNPPDDYYRSGRYQVTPGQEREACFLRSLTHREELAEFLSQRGYCWLDLDNFCSATEAFILASSLAPDIKPHGACAVMALGQWTAGLRQRLPPGFPQVVIHFPPRRFPAIPLEVERQFIVLETFERLLDEPIHQPWWDSLRQARGTRPVDVPSVIEVRPTR